MNRTKIVATIGPASEQTETLRALVRAGMDVARLNFSHAEPEWARMIVERLRRIADEERVALAILQDLRGPRLRVGAVPEGGLHLIPGALFTLSTRDQAPGVNRVYVDYPPLPQELQSGHRILIDDGKLELRVVATNPHEVVAEVVRGGILQAHKGINLPEVPLSAPAVTEKDVADVRLGVELGVDFVALSFVRRPADVLALREVLTGLGAPTPIIAKIERPEAVRQFEAILQVADGVMVARGDLGIEIGPEQVPLIQKQLIARCRLAGKPVITATQMLESMVEQPTPTRAEASDVANAVLDGTDAMMLSAESASGKYPVEAVATMARIAAAAEQALPEADYAPAPNTHPTQAITNAITAATVAAARELGARLIISLTESGYTARMVAKHRPATAILGVTPNPATYRQLALTWGVQPALIARHTHSDVMFAQARALVSQLGLAQHGETIVLTAGMPLGEPGRTNLLHIYQHGEDSGFHLPHDH